MIKLLIKYVKDKNFFNNNSFLYTIKNKYIKIFILI